VLRGTVRVNGETPAREAQLVTLARDGGSVRIEADSDATLLLLSGEPIAEPVVDYGPFMMNTEEEIGRAFSDFNSGQFGRMQ
jgi:redox-sensitive bicupin YhaK (pirin superfamily)